MAESQDPPVAMRQKSYKPSKSGQSPDSPNLKFYPIFFGDYK